MEQIRFREFNIWLLAHAIEFHKLSVNVGATSCSGCDGWHMQHVSCRDPSNIRHHRTIFRCPDDPQLRICALPACQNKCLHMKTNGKWLQMRLWQCVMIGDTKNGIEYPVNRWVSCWHENCVFWWPSSTYRLSIYLHTPHLLLLEFSIFFQMKISYTVVPPYPRVICSKTYRGYMKRWIILNAIYNAIVM
jgi:hypothetical protein